MAKRSERITFACARCGGRGTKRLIGPGSSRIWCARCENAVGNIDEKLDAILEKVSTMPKGNPCKAVGQFAGSWDRTFHTTCPECGKRLLVTRDNNIRYHVPAKERVATSPELDRAFKAVDRYFDKTAAAITKATTSHSANSDPRNPAHDLLKAAKRVVELIEESDADRWDAIASYREALESLKAAIAKMRE